MRYFAFDTETHRFRRGHKAPQLICVSWADSEKRTGLHNAREGLALLLYQLRDPATLIVGHNVAYDFACVIATSLVIWPEISAELNQRIWGAYRSGRVVDTGVVATLRRIETDTLEYCPVLRRKPGVSLADTALTYAGIELGDKSGTDHIRNRYAEVAHLDVSRWPAEFRDYAVKDATTTAAVWESLSPTCSPNAPIQCFHAWTLHLAGCWGWRTDPIAVAELKTELERRVKGVRYQLAQAGILSVDGTGYKASTKTIRDRIVHAYNAKGQRPPITEPTGKFPQGQVKTDTETLFNCGDPDLAALASIGLDETELSTFIPWLELGTTGPIHPAWEVLKETGRISCREPNITNQPRRKGVRRCYVPRSGFVYLCADYSAAELVALAQIWLERYGSSALAEAFKQGKDPHLITASQLRGRSYDATREAYKSGDIATADDRQLSKIANFGLPGGLSAKTFVDHVRKQTRKADGTFPAWVAAFDLTESQRVCSAWANAWPESRYYFNDAKRATSGRSGPYGVQLTNPRSGRVRGGLRYTTWLNTQFQERVADITKLAFTRCSDLAHTDPRSALWSSHPIGLIHDEIILEVPEQQLADCAPLVREIMVSTFAQFCPDVPVKVTPSACRRWHKGAEPVLVNDRLVPSKPVVDGEKVKWIHDEI